MISSTDIAQSIRALPTLSAAVTRLQELARDPDSSAEDFERAIRPDPALTANLLRLANTALFGARTRIVSVRQAITNIGLKRVVDVATSAAFARVLPQSFPGYQIESTSFWRHCIATAVLAEQLGRECGLREGKEVFTCALLHDVGKLVICSYLGQRERDLSESLDGSATLLEAERGLLGSDHCQVGRAVAEHWQLPEPIAAVITSHHEPNEVPQEHQVLTDLVHTADALAHSLGYGADVGGLARRFEPESMRRLGFERSHLERVASLTVTEIAEATALLEMTT